MIMSLTKSKLLKHTKSELSKLGYIQLEDASIGSDGLYAKLIADNLFLTLGLVISRYYDTKFTASFYLSKTTIWSALWGDIPKDSYKRISVFLTKEERRTFLSEEYTKEGIVDGWWDDSADSISDFISTVKITESRFVDQADLVDRIENSEEVNKLQYLSSQVIKEIVSDKDEEAFTYHFIPEKNIFNIPLIWFRAAERVLSTEKAILNANTVKRLAADAWRQEFIKNASNSAFK
jgi:hypothetical protein